MSLKCEAVKMSADNDFLSVHDDHDDESESESDSDSAAAADDVSAVQCHFKRRLQGSPLRHSVAADDSIVVNTLCALSAFKPLTASIKGVLHSASPASHSASSVLCSETSVLTSFCLSRSQSVTFSSAALTAQLKHPFLVPPSVLIWSHAPASHSCVHCLKELITLSDYNSGNCMHSAHDQKCSYCSIQ